MNFTTTSLILGVAPPAATAIWGGIVVLTSPYNPIKNNRRRFHVSSISLQAKLTHPLVWSVDWLRVSTGKYAVVDPHDPTHLVYLNEKEYHKLSNVIATQEETLQVVAHPFDEKPADKDIIANRPKSSPPQTTNTVHYWTGLRSRLGRSYRGFLSRGAAVLAPDKLTERLLIGFLTRIFAIAAYFSGIKELQSLKGTVSKRFSQHLAMTYRHRGVAGVVLLCKTSLVLINQYLAGSPKSSWDYGYPVRLSHGLPSWLPLEARHGIRSRSVKVLRFWSSLLYVYKVLSMPYKVEKAIKSIISTPFRLTSESTALLLSYRQFLKYVYVPYVLGGVRPIPKDKAPPTWFAPCSAGPNGSPAVNHIGSDAAAWVKRAETGGGDIFKGFKDPLLSVLLSLAKVLSVPMEWWKIERQAKHAQELKGETKQLRGYTLSRVHLLGEPAGKVRAVAIMDIFTQRVLMPLHDDLFKILGKLPQDGTMNQNTLMARLKETFAKPGGYWSSIDISTATDSIPCILYRVLLEELYGMSDLAIQLADKTIQLMTDRDFHLSADPKLKDWPAGMARNDTIRYGRGQPMGCLGSFGLLGLWNNSWVQFASYMTTGKLLQDYGVTGDDVVIRDSDPSTPIGKKYVEHCKVFEIPISLAKSFVSGQLFNFLSRTVIEGGEISPLSWKEDLTIQGASGRVERAFKLRDRDYWSSLGSGWLSKAVKYFLYPSEYLLHVKDVQRGVLSGYGMRAILSYLVPSSTKIRALGLQGVPIFSWLAACAGSVSLLAHGEMVRKDTPPKLLSESDRINTLLTYSSLLLGEVKDLYDQVIQTRAHFASWHAQQHACVREPGCGSLFVPSVHQFEYEYSGLHGMGAVETHVLPVPFNLSQAYLIPVNFMNTVPRTPHETYVSPMSVGHVSEMSWRLPQNLQGSINRILSWMEAIPTSRNYLDPDLFENAAVQLKRYGNHRANELTKGEARLFSSLFQMTLMSGGALSLDLAPQLADFVERRMLREYGIL